MTALQHENKGDPGKKSSHQNSAHKDVIYDEIDQAMKGLLGSSPTPTITFESALVSLIALLKERLPNSSWVGFYRNDSGHLWVGPYQGKLACIHLRPGQGVCGAALQQQKTIIVEDVHAFEGHVFCDPLAASEIVLPVYHHLAGERTLLGVLDLDSHQKSAFDQIDAQRLARLLKEIEPLPSRVIL